MKVRFGPEVFTRQTFGGVSRYIVELDKGLRRKGVDSAIFAGVHANEHLRDTVGIRGVAAPWVVRRLRPAPLHLVNQVALRVAANRWRNETTIYHPSFPAGPVPRGPRVAVTIYDMIHDRFPDQLLGAPGVQQDKRRWCHAADVIFAISHHTKADLVELYDVDPDKVVVTHLGVRRTRPCASTVERLRQRPPFVLFVGGRNATYKNFERGVAAYVRSGIVPDVRLVCIGQPPTDEELSMLDRHGVRDRVEHRHATEAELASHYQEATALLYPSLYEGFGLPPLEAMAHGCPVITSDRSSLPEVVGDAALVVDPEDVEAMAAALVRVVEDEGLCDALAAAGRRRAAELTWASTVDETLAGYRRTMERTR